MKNLSVAISNDDFNKFGLTKETYSFGEFLSIIENEITLSTPTSTGIFRPIKKDISVKQMIKAQQYHGIDADILDNITRELNILEPLDELLKSV